MIDTPTVCISCGDTIDEDDPAFETPQGEVCRSCYNDDREHAPRVVRFSPEGTHVVAIGEYGLWEIDEGAPAEELSSRTAPDWVKHFLTPAWHSTDAWRGFFALPSEGLHKVTDGWITGYPDESVSHKAPTWESYQALSDDNNSCPVVVYWVIAQTSNVFSQGVDVYTGTEADAVQFYQWLWDELNIRQVDFYRAFG